MKTVKRSKGLAAMPLILGLASLGVAPTAGALGVNQVDIVNGFFDVNEDGVVNASDDLANVILWCDDHRPSRVDIINGGVDVTEVAGVTATDDLFNCDLNDEDANNLPTTNQVDIINGGVDVTESGVVSTLDDATNIQLFVLP